MTRFNIYYGYNKINLKPLDKEDIDNIKRRKYIYKVIDGKNQQIKTSNIKVIKCTVL